MATKATDSHIEQIKAGSREAWQFVKEDFEVGLRSQAIRMLKSNCLVGQVTADDLVQETWLKAWNARASFRGTHVPEFVKWLLTILRNTVYDKCRKGRFELTAPDAVANVAGAEKTPSAIASLAENNSDVAALLATLDGLSRRIIKLKHFEGLTFLEIAKRLNRNPNSVASIYRRTIRRLRHRLSEGSSGCIRIT